MNCTFCKNKLELLRGTEVHIYICENCRVNLYYKSNFIIQAVIHIHDIDINTKNRYLYVDSVLGVEILNKGTYYGRFDLDSKTIEDYFNSTSIEQEIKMNKRITKLALLK